MNTNNLFDDTIVLRKKLNDKTMKKKAMREGNFVTKAKPKSGGALNYKLDMETEELKHKKIDISLSREIVQARVKKGLNQKQLANMINKPQSVINQYENGTAIVDNNILAILQRKLGIKLLGKKNNN